MVKHIHYVRYMHNFVNLVNTSWNLRKTVSKLNSWLEKMELEQHPGNTFIVRLEKGFNWMEFWFNEVGCQRVAPRAVSNFLTGSTKLRRL